jgi:hypothetical protein
MSDRLPFDLDAGLAELAEAARRSAPEVPDRLRARVLADAAEISTLRMAAPGAARAQRARELRRARPGARRTGWRLFGVLDAWGAAAVGVVALCLVIGLGVGYEAGDEVLAGIGIAPVDVALAGDPTSGDLLLEDVL